MMRRRHLVIALFLTASQAYKPPPEEELLAQILVRNLFKNERTFRRHVPYDVALVSSHTIVEKETGV